MSLADARCSAVQCASVVSAGAITAGSIVSAGAVGVTGTVTATSIDADIVTGRVVFITSNAGGAAAITSSVIAALTGGAALFVQQVSSGSAIVPVVADTYEPVVGAGFVIRLTAAAPMPANVDFNVYIARY